MEQLSTDQLNTLSKEALITIAVSLQDQLGFVQDQLNSANSLLEDNNRQIELLTEQIRIMNQRQHGRKAESALNVEGQLTLFDGFNEAEVLSKPNAPEPEITEIIVSSHTRSKTKGKRDEDLDGLPARIIEHKLTKAELTEKFPEGYKELPHEIYKRLHIIPETFIVDEHHVHVYASKSNNDMIVKAPRSVDLFRNSIATPSLLASIINGKYVNALPLERQSRAFKYNGVSLSTNTLANWVINGTTSYPSLAYDRMQKPLISDSKVIHADETPVKVMRIDGEKVKNGKNTYMWVYRNRPSTKSPPIVLYDWQPSRRADHPREFLKGFSGTVVTDGYQVYHKLDKERQNLNVAGCWVHARRPFAEFIKSIGTQAAKGSVAQEAYDMITKIMHVDNDYDDLSAKDRKIQRQKHLQEKVDAYFAWVKVKYDQVTHNSVIGKALAYSIHQEEYLRKFLSDGNIPMDNNFAEQAIRPFTIGRKNFVIIESDNGAKASAMLYSLAETAKANQINTYQYFELLLTEIPKHMDEKDLSFLDDLMPWSPRAQKECPSRFKKT